MYSNSSCTGAYTLVDPADITTPVSQYTPITANSQQLSLINLPTNIAITSGEALMNNGITIYFIWIKNGNSLYYKMMMNNLGSDWNDWLQDKGVQDFVTDPASYASATITYSAD